jgi:hypothetical protein
MVLRIKHQLFTILLLGSVCFSFGQINSVRKADPQETLLITCGMIFHPKDMLNPVIKSPVCENKTESFFLNGLELPLDSLAKLNLNRKQVYNNQSFYELCFKGNDSLSCIEHINFFITVTISIILNGEELSMAKSLAVLENISTDKIISIKRLYPHSKRKTSIEIVAKE